MTITYALMEKFEEIEKQTEGKRAKLISKARVDKLLKDASGAIIGCEYIKGGNSFTELGPVVIATGGYGADKTADSLLIKYRADLKNVTTTNGEHCTGDGIKMA